VSRRAYATLLWLAIVLASAVYVGIRLRVNSDFSAFLPLVSTSEQRFLVTELKEGVASRLLLIELGGDTPERLAVVSRALTQRIAVTDAFRYVNNGDAEWHRRDLDLLRAHRYQLSDGVTAERFTVEELRAALTAQVQALATGSGLFEKSLLAADPTGETLHILERLTAVTRPRQDYGVWFSSDGARALLVAETRAAGSDLDGQSRALASVESAFALASAGTATTLRYSSPGAMAAQSRALIAADATRLGLVSTLLILAVLAFVYRSPRVLLLCAVPALTGLLVGVAAVDAAFGGVHAITLGFGATLLGEAVDYPSYLLTQIQPGEEAPATLARIGRTLAMAVLTTAASSVALLLAGFPGLAQLGLLTMVGVLGAGAVTAWVLPQWVPARWRAATVSASPRWSRPAISTRTRLALAAGLAVALAALSSGKPWWDDDLANMNPLPDELKQRDRELRGALAAPDVRWMLLIEAPTREDVLETAERLRPALEQAVAAHTVGGFDLVSDYLPSRAKQKQRQAALPEQTELHARFAEAARGLPLRIDAFDPFFAAVAAARTAAPLDAGELVGTGIGVKLEALLRHDEARWQGVVTLTGVHDADALRASIERVGLVGVRAIDLQATSRDLMADFRAHALGAFSVGAILILAVLAIGLSSVHAAASIALPVTAAVLATAAALVVLGQRLSVFHLVALMLVAGIVTNYALFLARAALAGGVPGTLVRSLAVVVGTTLCAFGTLASSRVPVLHAIGLTVTLGVALGLAFSLLLPLGGRQPSLDR
jgi:predicted exporter